MPLRRKLDVDIVVLGQIQHDLAQRPRVLLIGRCRTIVIQCHLDIGKTSDNRLDCRQLIGWPVEQETGAQFLGALPNGILVCRRPLGRIIRTPQMQTQPAKTMLLHQLLQPVRRLGRMAIQQPHGGKFARKTLHRIAHITIVVQITNRLHDDGLVHGCRRHHVIEHLDRTAGFMGASLRKRIALGVVTPYM